MIYLFKKNNKGGFTLIEILVSIFLLSLILLGVNRIYFAISQNQKEAITETFVHSDIEYFLKLAGNNIKLAQKSDGLTCPVIEDQFFDLINSDHGILFGVNDGCLSFNLVDNNGVGAIEMIDAIYSVDQIITSSKTDILELLFTAEDDIATGQPIVTILVKAAPASDPDNYIYAQSSISLGY
ncbi:MAG: prepilin-type N-terminal cleavage/methylation domain-containing protein [Patescibacteria group bacterium]|jgi:prepilin-type N-terminal cleavage/methylation domain-containing protein